MPKVWLPSEDELVLALHAEGLSRGQIAARLGVTRNAICGRVHRLTKKKREQTHKRRQPRRDWEATPESLIYLEDCNAVAQSIAARGRHEMAQFVMRVAFQRFFELNMRKAR